MSRKSFITPVFTLLLTASSAPAGATGGINVYHEWFALGSGCRAKHDIAGDVTQEFLPASGVYPGYQRIRFHLPKMKLNADAQVAVNRNFGRECAIRLKVVPAPEKKISDVIAETSLTVTKPMDVKLTLASQLKIGQAVLDERKETLEEQVAPDTTTRNVVLGNPVVVPKEPHLTAGILQEQAFASLKCGEPKIVGVDLTWIAETKLNKPRELSVSLGEGRTVDIFVKTEKCPQ